MLPFHQMGRYKWQKLGIDYTLEDVEPPTPAVVERTCAAVPRRGTQAY